MPNALHRPVAFMSKIAAEEFPDADFLVAVKLAKDAAGKPIEGPPVITVLVRNTFKVVRTDLSGADEIPANNGQSYQLLPKADEMLQMIEANGATTYCVNRPSWRWFILSVSEL